MVFVASLSRSEERRTGEGRSAILLLPHFPSPVTWFTRQERGLDESLSRYHFSMCLFERFRLLLSRTYELCLLPYPQAVDPRDQEILLGCGIVIDSHEAIRQGTGLSITKGITYRPGTGPGP